MTDNIIPEYWDVSDEAKARGAIQLKRYHESKQRFLERQRHMAEAQVKADATGKAVVCNGRLFEPKVRMERRL
jgi:hypothetical protein